MSATVDYLSPGWFDQANAAIGDLAPVSASVTVAVRILAEGAGTDVHYRLILGPDRVAMVADDRPGDVRMTMTYSTACAIATAGIGAQRAFLDGDIQLGGDTTALLGFQQQLTDIEDRLAGLRARTRY